MEVFSWFVTLLIGVLLVSWALYLFGIQRLPREERPRVPIYNRFGEPIGVAENPDFHLNPGEEPQEAPPVHPLTTPGEG